MNKPIVKVDIDGVLRDIFTPMCEIYNKDFNDDMSFEKIKEYDVDISFPRIKEELGIPAFEYFFVIHGHEVFYTKAKPIEGAKEAMDRLRDSGFRVIVVSNQKSTQNKIDAINFLADNEIYYDDIFFTNKKYLLDGDILIDDNPRFLKDETNTKVLIDAPYNKWYNVDNRYNSIIDFANSVL